MYDALPYFKVGFAMATPYAAMIVLTENRYASSRLRRARSHSPAIRYGRRQDCPEAPYVTSHSH